MLSNDEHFEIERELAAAMAQHTDGLPRPRVDLRAIRRRTATRRRILVPVVAASVALVTAAPFAVAQSGLLETRSSGSAQGHAVTSTPMGGGSAQAGGFASTQGSMQAPTQGSHKSQAGAQGGVQGSAGSTLPDAGGLTKGGCVNLRAPLTMAEHNALAQQATAAFQQARANLAGALAKSGLGEADPVSFSDSLPNQLMPQVGTVVDQVDCAGKRHLSPSQAKAALDQLRAAVLSSGVVASVVMDRTSGFLGLSAGDMSGSASFVRMSDNTLVMSGTFSSHGMLPFEHTMTMTMRLPDCGVTKLDLRDLGLRGTSLSDLRSSLSKASGGMQGVVPGILTADATVLSLPTS